MKLFIKYMVSNRCKMVVKQELQKLDLHFVFVDLGEIDIMEDITDEQRDELNKALLATGLELIDDKKAILIEKIKTVNGYLYGKILLQEQKSRHICL